MLQFEGGDSSAEQGMSLAGVAPESGGGGGADADLKHTEGPWTHAAGVVVELQADTDTGLTQLETAHTGVQAHTEGLETTAALSAVLFSWQERLKSVRDEAGSLEAPLRKVAQDHGELEAAQKAMFSQVAPLPKQGKGGR
ncbi:hypothetical protein [Streptomyces sp. NPDC002825]|uniref:hypothetical protein n=1 Tax=Streptomyces sp. NPDC002825 TaxID=3154666 RepID=UPI003324639B